MSSSKLPTLTSPPWSASTKSAVAFGVLVLLVLVASKISGSVWTTLLVTLVLGYLLSPIVRFVERRVIVVGSPGLRRTLSVLVSWVIVLGLLGLVVGLIVPATFAQLREFADELPRLAQSAEEDIKGWLSRPISLGDFTLVPWDELQSFLAPSGEAGTQQGLTETLRSAVLTLADSGLGVLGGAVTLVFNSFIALVLIFYLMRDGPAFALYVLQSVPESYRGDVERLMVELGLIWNAYLRGQLLLGTSVGVATYFAALILGLPQPLVLGLLAGFLEFIPNIGPTLSSIPAILFALTTPSSTFAALDAGIVYALVVALAYVVIQQVEAVFLVPRILGGSLDLHPFVVLVAILVGANLGGVLGVLLAAPTVATLRLMVRYLRGKLLDEEVFPVVTQHPTRRSGFVYALIRYFLNRRFGALEDEVELVRSRYTDPAGPGALRSDR